MGLNVRSGGADVSEHANLNGGGDDGLDGGGATWWVRRRLSSVCGEPWEDLPNNVPFFCNFHGDVLLVSLERRTGECS